MGNACSPSKIHDEERQQQDMEEARMKELEASAKKAGYKLERSASGQDLRGGLDLRSGLDAKAGLQFPPNVEDVVPEWNLEDDADKRGLRAEATVRLSVINKVPIPPLKVRKIQRIVEGSDPAAPQYTMVKKPVLPPSPRFAGRLKVEKSKGFRELVKGEPSIDETELLAALNKARTNPKYYATYIKKMLNYYDKSDRTFLFPNSKVKLATHEGRRAFDDAIKFLEKQSPVPELKLSRGMSLACRDLVADHGPRNMGAHVGSDRSTFGLRMMFYGSWTGTCGENCGYGTTLGEHMIAKLLADDGVAERGHRKNIFNTEFTAVGVAAGPHLSYGKMCVMKFATAFQESSKERQDKVHKRRLLYFYTPMPESLEAVATNGRPQVQVFPDEQKKSPPPAQPWQPYQAPV